MIAEEVASQILANAGYGMNPCRRAVFRALVAGPAPVTAEQLWIVIGRDDRTVSRSTVANVLRLFDRLELLSVTVQGKRNAYALRPQVQAERSSGPTSRTSKDLKGALAHIESSGHVMNSQRRAVLSVLVDAERPLDAEAVSRGLVALGAPTSITTVYRALKLFHEHGVVEVGARQGLKQFFQIRRDRSRISLVMSDGSGVAELAAGEIVCDIEAYLSAKGFELAGGVYLSVNRSNSETETSDLTTCVVASPALQRAAGSLNGGHPV